MKSPLLLVICGVKNSGKTTLIEKLIPALQERGILTGTIKRDGHSFTPDTPGKDSYRFFQAGACASAIFDEVKYSISSRVSVDESFLATMMPEAQLIILEGFRETDYPKIEVVRGENSKKPACNMTNCIALVSDLPLEYGVPVFGLDEIEIIADFITQEVKNGRLN